jgi:GNAT superfamily N-acetyltransferase
MTPIDPLPTEVAVRDPDEVRLRDGTRAWIVPLLKTDRAALAREFETLSPESRRRRFLAPVMHLSESMLEQLVDDVDGIDHVALVLMAENPTDPLAAIPVGIARVVRYTEHPAAADLAVTVKDAWQGRGVASALLAALIPQRPAGVTHILTEVVTDNPASVAMLKALGEVHTRDSGNGIMEVEIDLDGNGPYVATEPVTLHNRWWLRSRDRLCPWLDG